MVEIPYSGGKFAMYVMLPDAVGKQGLKQLVSAMEKASWKDLRNSFTYTTKVHLRLPKFETASRFQLAPILQALGIRQAFGMSASFDAADQFFKDGDEIDIADGYTLKVIHTPGHTPGGVCFYCEKAKALFSGDTLFCASIGRTDFPGGDYQILMQSLKRLMLLDDDVMVYPGHNADTNIGYERTHNPFIA
jgi:glyoxylase-like metal-dependent hydrolase (beta-lactamase superfamily II)